MSEEKNIARAGQVTALAQLAVARDAALKRVEEIKQNTNLSIRQKRDLVNAEVTAIIIARKREIENRLKILDMKLGGDARMAQAALEAYQFRVIAEIRNEAYEFIHKKVKRQMFARFELMAELGERLGEFKRSLANRKIEKSVLKTIMAQADRAVNDTIEQLGKKISELIVSEQDTEGSATGGS